MPHIKDASGAPVPHTRPFDDILANQMDQNVDRMNAASVKQLNPVGASATDMSQVSGGVLNTLPAYQQALTIANQVYQDREPLSPALLSLMYFSKLAEESSKPGATLLGAAGAAAATPAAYLMEERKQQRADEKAKGTLAATLTTTLTKAPPATKLYINPKEPEKTIRLSESELRSRPDRDELVEFKIQKPSAPSAYTIVNLDQVNKALGTTLPEGTKTIDLTPSDFAKLPIGSAISYQKDDKPVQPQSYIVTAEGGITLSDGRFIKAGETTLLTAAEAIENRGSIKESTKEPSPFEAEKFLTAQYDKAFPVKTYRDLDQQFQKVQISYEQAYTIDRPQVADVSMIFAYMKMLDPRSVVREGEQAQAQGTGGALDLAINTYNKLLGGGSLTDAQRKSFRDAAYALITPAIKDLNDFNVQFKGRADPYKINFEGFKVSPKNYLGEAGKLPFFMMKPDPDQLQNKTNEELLLLLQADNLKDDDDFINAVNEIVNSRL